MKSHGLGTSFPLWPQSYFLCLALVVWCCPSSHLLQITICLSFWPLPPCSAISTGVPLHQWFLTFLRSWIKWRRYVKVKDSLSKKGHMCIYVGFTSIPCIIHSLAALLVIYILTWVYLEAFHWPASTPIPTQPVISPSLWAIVYLNVKTNLISSRLLPGPWLLVLRGSLCSAKLSNGLGKWSVHPDGWHLTPSLSNSLYYMGRNDLLIAWVWNLNFYRLYWFEIKYTAKSIFLLQIKLCPQDPVSEMTVLWNFIAFCNIYFTATAGHI